MKGLPTRPRLNVELTRFPADLYQNHRKIVHFCTKCTIFCGASGRTRTYNPSVNSRMFVQHRKTVSTIICDAELQRGLCRGLCSLPSSEILLQFFPLNNS